MNEQKTIKQHFRANEVAELLGIGVSTVWLYARQGKLNPIKLSARITVFTKADIDSFVSRAAEVA